MKKTLFILFAVMSAATMFAAEEATNVEVNAPTDWTHRESVWRSGCKFYQGETLLTKQEYQNLLRNTSPEAFRQYDTGRKLIISGWSVFGVGASLAAFGSSLMIGDAIALNNRDDNELVMPFGYIFGTAFMIASTPFIATGIPLLSVGYTKRNKSVDIYNQALNKEPAITYHLTAGNNGIGLAINF